MPENEEVTETATVAEQEAGTETEAETSAETETTETAESEAAATVPKARLDQVIGQRNESRKENAALTERLERLETKIEEADEKKAAPADDAPVPTPPANLTDEKKVEWLIRHHAGNYINEELGMSLKEAKSLLSTSKETSSDFATRRWQKACADHGLDAENQDVQAFVLGLARGHEKPNMGEIFTKAKGIFGKKAESSGNGDEKPPERSTATAEETGVTGVMTGDKRIYRNAKEATAAALKGQIATEESLSEILERTAREAKK